MIRQRLDADMIGRTGALHAAPCLSASGGNVEVSGHITATLLESGLSLEVMDYSFSQHTLIACDAQEPFIELLDLDSVEAVCKLGTCSCPVAPGMHVTFCTEASGQLVFSAGVPVRGLRIRLPLNRYDDEILARFPQDAPSHELLRRYNNRPLYDGQIRGIFRQIKSSLVAGVGSELYFESKLLELIHLIASYGSSPCGDGSACGNGSPCGDGSNPYNNSSRHNGNGRHDDRQCNGVGFHCDNSLAKSMEQIKRLLSERLSSPPTVAELARLTNICPSKLHRDFKRHADCTIHEYLQRLRMSKAQTLVCVSDEPLYRIARMVGYHKPGSFSKAYRQAHGISPSQDRSSRK